MLEGARQTNSLEPPPFTVQVSAATTCDAAASMMASSGIPRLTIGKILNHVDRSITAVHDRHSYDPEKRAARSTGGICGVLVENADGARVLPFARKPRRCAMNGGGLTLRAIRRLRRIVAWNSLKAPVFTALHRRHGR